MPRYHGKKATVYLATAAGGVAVSRKDLSSWELNFPSDKGRTTSFEDLHHVYAKGKQDPKGKLSAFFDVANVKGVFDAAADDDTGVKFYIYPHRSAAAKFFSGTTWVDITKVGANVEGAIQVDIDLTPASDDWLATL